MKPIENIVSPKLSQFNKRLRLPDEVIKKSEQYLLDLLEYNQRVNLISRKDEESIVEHHWLHCVMGLLSNDWKEVRRIADIGSGGGFPGLILGIMFPDIKIFLIESIQKKALFLKKEVEFLKLKNVRVLNDRFENVKSSFPSGVDVVTARAVAALPRLWDYAVTVLNPGGYLFAWKGECESEIKSLQKKGSIQSIRRQYPVEDMGVPKINTSQYIIVEKK